MLLQFKFLSYMIETARPFIVKKNYLDANLKKKNQKGVKQIQIPCSCHYLVQSLLLYTFGQQHVTMIFMPLYSWYCVSNIQTEYFLSAAVRFGCQWCKLRNCDVIQICKGWNFQFEFWINWLRWNFLRLGNFKPFLAIGFPSMAIFRPTNAKRNILVKKKSL